MNTIALVFISILMLIFSIVVYFNRNIDNFQACTDVQLSAKEYPSKCRLIHDYWKEYKTNYNNSYNQSIDAINKCTDNNSVEAKSKLNELVNLFILEREEDNNLICEQWNAKLQEGGSGDNELISDVTNLENALNEIIDGNGSSEIDKYLFENGNIDINSLKDICANIVRASREYSNADIWKALWCKLNCGSPNSRLQDLNDETY